MIAPKLSGCRCQCCACWEYFTSERSFNRHRVGEHGKSRRCLSVAEMLALGWAKSPRGFWSHKALARARADLAAPPSSHPATTLQGA